jgi:DNA-binding CsgD family transcriptional regulator
MSGATPSQAVVELSDVLLRALTAHRPLPAEGLLRPLATLTCSDLAGWHVVVVEGRATTTRLWPCPERACRVDQLLREAPDRHPLVRHYATTRDLAVRTAAEASPTRAWWAASAARRLARDELGIDHQLGIPLTFHDGVLRTFVVGRAGRTWTVAERERARWAQRAIRAIDVELPREIDIRVPVQAATTDHHDRPPGSDEHGGALTPREVQVLAAVGDGTLRYTAARRLGMSPRTLDKHLQHAYAKLGVGDLLSALTAAEALGHPVRRSGRQLQAPEGAGSAAAVSSR